MKSNTLINIYVKVMITQRLNMKYMHKTVKFKLHLQNKKYFFPKKKKTFLTS